MADDLNLQNSSASADQSLSANGGLNDSLTPSPAKSPLEEAGVEDLVVSNEPTPVGQPVAASQPEIAASQMPVAQDDSMAASTLPNLEPVGSPLPSTDIASPVVDVPVAEPSMSVASPIPAGAPDPMNMPDITGPTMPTQPAAEVPDTAVPSVPAPNMGNFPDAQADSGEPSEAPDTDEFLQSILDNKVQGQASDQLAETAPAAPDSEMPSPTEELETPDTQTPQTPQPPAPNSSLDLEAPVAPFVAPSPAETAPALTELAAEPAPAPLEQPIDTMMPEMAASPDMSQANPPAMDSPVDSSSATQPGATDSLSSTTSPMTDSPDQSVASDIFSKKPTQSSKSPIKLIAIVLLVAVALGGIYFVAKKYFFPAATSSTAQSGLGTATPASSAVALTGDVARRADLKAIQQALLNLYSANGKYPVAADYIKLSQAGNVVEKELVPNYLSKLPSDLDKTRAYQYKSDGTIFTLTAVLDDYSGAGVSMENGVVLYKVDQSTDVPSNYGAAGVTSDTTASGSASSNLF